MDAVDEVKSRLAIEDVISEYVQLKRAGRNYRGLSPFSSEKTPSFMVSPEKQIWHDFSSGKGGNVFSFVMEMEGLDFKGALELLARKAGVDLDQYRGKSSGGQNKERLYQALEAATHFYQVQFSKNRTPLEYVFKQRRFTKETALTWRLGYAPSSGTALINYLKSKNFTDNEIKRAGLTNSYGKDMFRGRLMIPLADAQGRVIGFTARLLTNDKTQPKYINTPATPLYDKSRHVYGLHQAKEAIRRDKFAVLVEGNLDVIASHQAGVTNAVATAGTALTEQHLKTLGRFTPDIRLCFDADQAGVNATERAIPIASKAGVALSIISVPSGKDPDELIKNEGTEAWQKLVQTNTYALDWLIDRYKNILDITSGQGKKRFSDILLPIVRSLQDSVEQDHYLRQIADSMGVGVAALNTKMGQPATSRQLKRPKTTVVETDKAAAERRKTQSNLLAILLMHAPLRAKISVITPAMLDGEASSSLLEYLQANPEAGRNDLRPPAQMQNIVDDVIMVYEENYRGLELVDIHNEAARMQTRLVSDYVKKKKQELRTKYPSSADSQQLAAESREYDVLLSKVKGA